MNTIINTHTPAEWQIGAGPHTRDREVFDNDGTLIADCRTNTRGAAEERANARLIASAPELLEVLKNMKVALRQLENMTSELLSDADCGELSKAHNQARTAIAKAEGSAE